MKSRILGRQPAMILSYGIKDTKLTSLIKVCDKYNIVVRQVLPSEVGRSISNLLKVAQLNIEHYPDGCEECILMVGFKNSTMNKFLDTLKDESINIPLKAVLTPNNKTWTFENLLKELKLEHEKLNDNI